MPDGYLLAAIDIDHCLDERNTLTPMAADILNTMAAYSEYSPSGKGVRILFLVSPSFVYDASQYYINRQDLGLEIYVAGSTSKYVSVTGNTWTPGMDLKVRDAKLLTVMNRYMKREVRQTVQPQIPANAGSRNNDLTPEDIALIQAIQQSYNGKKFMALMNGDTSMYRNDHSRADLALCNFIAARSQDSAQIDRIFRNSRLWRPKWDSPNGAGTYGSRTIQKALSSRAEYQQQRTRQQQSSASTVQQPQAKAVQMPLYYEQIMSLLSAQGFITGTENNNGRMGNCGR